MPKNKLIHFEKIDFSLLESMRYDIEKWRTVVEEVKVGSAVVDEFMVVMYDLSKVVTEKSYPFSAFVDKALEKMTLWSAKVTIVDSEEETYYMRPDEILFISNVDYIFSRARKRNGKE